MDAAPQHFNLIETAAEIVAAYVSKNPLPASALPALIEAVHGSIATIMGGTQPQPVVGPVAPAVPIRKSVTDEFIVCLEDGKKFKSLKRHLQSAFAMSPDEYRTKWGLRSDYPMVAPAYAAARSALARKAGLGQKKGTIREASNPAAAPAAPKRGRGRPRAAA